MNLCGHIDNLWIDQKLQQIGILLEGRFVHHRLRVVRIEPARFLRVALIRHVHLGRSRPAT